MSDGNFLPIGQKVECEMSGWEGIVVAHGAETMKIMIERVPPQYAKAFLRNCELNGPFTHRSAHPNAHHGLKKIDRYSDEQ